MQAQAWPLAMTGRDVLATAKVSRAALLVHLWLPVLTRRSVVHGPGSPAENQTLAVCMRLQTGSGKTCGYLIPAITRVLESKQPRAPSK